MEWIVLVMSFGERVSIAALMEEAARIQNLLKRDTQRWSPWTKQSYRVRVAVATSSEDLASILEQSGPLIIHVVGPGGEISLDREETLSASELAAIFGSRGCVLLNAYYTLERAEALLEQVDCVVGTPETSSEASDLFWTAFYEGIAQDLSYGAAFKLGWTAGVALGLPPDQFLRFASRNLEIYVDHERIDGFSDDPNFRPSGSPYPVWFGTNRAPVDANNPTLGFSAQRGNEIYFGTCLVEVPRYHRVGTLNPAWWQRILSREDSRLKLDKKSIRVMSCDVFWAELARVLAEREAGKRMGLVVIHGYNVNFEDAARRAAQIGFDLDFPGATAFFTWPSQGRLTGYAADEATIPASEKHIARFLLEFTRRSGAEAVHVIAHSMGNRGLLRAMQRILAEVGLKTDVPFGQVLLAAPDEDHDVFLDLAPAFQRLARRTTLYVSARDKALASSTLIHDAPRAGLTPPVTIVPGIDTVDVTNVDVSLLGHGYFAEARDLLHDIHSLIVHDAPPSERMGLRQTISNDGRKYWLIGA